MICIAGLLANIWVLHKHSPSDNGIRGGISLHPPRRPATTLRCSAATIRAQSIIENAICHTHERRIHAIYQYIPCERRIMDHVICRARGGSWTMYYAVREADHGPCNMPCERRIMDHVICRARGGSWTM